MRRRAGWNEERAFPRLQYPSHLRPYLRMAGELCEVVDCAERGIRYAGAVEPPAVGREVRGRICFRGGAEVEIRGRVVRVQDGEVALALFPAHAVPGEVIAAELAALGRAAPDLLPPPLPEAPG